MNIHSPYKSNFSASLVDSTLINTFFINKGWILWSLFYTQNIKKYLWSMIKRIQMTFSEFWVSWAYLQHLSSAWVFGHGRQLHNSWEHLRVCEVTQAFRWVLLSVSIRAANDPLVFTIMVKAPTRVFSWLKTPTSTFTFKTHGQAAIRLCQSTQFHIYRWLMTV